MPLMMEKLYDALRAGSVPEPQAREAAIEAAGYENRLNRLESDLTVLKWMVGFNLAFTVAIVEKTAD